MERRAVSEAGCAARGADVEDAAPGSACDARRPTNSSRGWRRESLPAAGAVGGLDGLVDDALLLTREVPGERDRTSCVARMTVGLLAPAAPRGSVARFAADMLGFMGLGSVLRAVAWGSGSPGCVETEEEEATWTDVLDWCSRRCSTPW